MVALVIWPHWSSILRDSSTSWHYWLMALLDCLFSVIALVSWQYPMTALWYQHFCGRTVKMSLSDQGNTGLMLFNYGTIEVALVCATTNGMAWIVSGAIEAELLLLKLFSTHCPVVALRSLHHPLVALSSWNYPTVTLLGNLSISGKESGIPSRAVL